MTRNKAGFICNHCGSVQAKWSGKCEDCGSWNSFVDNSSGRSIASFPFSSSKSTGRVISFTNFSGPSDEGERIVTGLKEFDRVTGGGFVCGSVTLIGGEPGIGKSTLLTQTAAYLSLKGFKIFYISGEESIAQIRLRSQRLSVSKSHVALAAETNVEDIITTLQTEKRVDLIIIDSIQTLWSATINSAPGTVTQVRYCVYALINYAKQSGTAVVLVGHVTKDGQIAGPRLVEHMVDSVLYFEGDRRHHYRLLRGIKNRFGATDEMGVFEMSALGLREVPNPSALFLTDPNLRAPGMVVYAGIEGTRPILVEIQALVVSSNLGTPRRSLVGWDQHRLSMVLAVLEAHCGVKLASYDIYLNVAGGYRIQETSADMAVAAALISSLFSVILPSKSIYFGEISLSGSLRPVSYVLQRLKESQKLGFTQAVLPVVSQKTPITLNNMDLTYIQSLSEIVARIKSRQLHSTRNSNELLTKDL